METKITSGIFWKFMERFATQMASLIITLFLARILSPKEYGTIALLTVFITLSDVLVSDNFQSALIQNKSIDNLDYSSAFYTNVVVSIFVYALIYISAPVVGGFYDDELLVPVLRVLGLKIMISAFNSIQRAYVTRNMLFRKFFISTLTGTIVSGAVGIILALNGAGVWSLVSQIMLNVLIDTVVLWIIVKWRPIAEFSSTRIRKLWKYEWKLLLSNMLNRVYETIQNMTIGKVYSKNSLALYDKGFQFPSLIATNIDTTVSSVMFPALSQRQADTNSVKQLVRKIIGVTSYIICPILIGLFVLANDIISLLLTDKWLPCAPYFRIACIAFCLFPIHTANLTAIKAVGRSDEFLKLEIIKTIIGVGLVCSVIHRGIMAFAWVYLADSVISCIINSYPNRKLINYSYRELLVDCIPTYIISTLMGLGVYSLSLFGINRIVILPIQIVLGVVLYVGLSLISHNKNYYLVLSAIKARVNGR